MLKGIVEELHQSYLTANKVVDEKYKELKDKTQQDTLNTLLSEGKIDEIENLMIEESVDIYLYKNFLQVLLTKLYFYIEAAKIAGEDLSEDVLKFYDDNKKWLPTPIFTVEKDKIVEKEEGTLQKRREEFLESPMFKQTKESLEKEYERMNSSE